MKARPSARHAYAEAEIVTGLAHQIKAIRLQRGWTQRELAKRIGTTQTGVSRLEDPSYGKYTLGTLFDLMKAFDTGLKVQFISFASMFSETFIPNPEVRIVESFEEEAKDIDFYDEDKSYAPVTIEVSSPPPLLLEVFPIAAESIIFHQTMGQLQYCIEEL